MFLSQLFLGLKAETSTKGRDFTMARVSGSPAAVGMAPPTWLLSFIGYRTGPPLFCYGADYSMGLFINCPQTQILRLRLVWARIHAEKQWASTSRCCITYKY